MFSKSPLFPKNPDEAATPGTTPAVGGSVSAPAVSSASAAPRTGRIVPSAADSDSGKGSGADTAAAGESRLVVGPNVKLRGAEISDCDTLIVEGRVEAKMDSRVIRVAENGFFSGTVGIDVAEINGRFEGELTARTQLIIRSTGCVSGTIRYGKIFIEEGGQISGDIKAIDPAVPASASGSPGGSASGSGVASF